MKMLIEFFVIGLLIGCPLMWRYASVGTKSVLLGAHCFFLHPFFVFAAWWKLYGFPYDPRLWVAFFVHDLGYWGCPNIDGPEGELHPYWGAKVMHALFDKRGVNSSGTRWQIYNWYKFTLYHSRFLAKKNNEQYSKLCVADKYSITITPMWLYLPMVILTGEIKEYMKDADYKYKTMNLATNARRLWFRSVQDYLRKWSIEHKDIKTDTWTPDQKEAKDKSGVWK